MYMKRKIISLITIITMLLSLVIVGPALATSGTTQLIVHYYRLDGKYKANIKATSLDGGIKGKVSKKTNDAYGLKMTFNFKNINDNDYISIGVKEDSVFPKEKKKCKSKKWSGRGMAHRRRCSRIQSTPIHKSNDCC